MSGDDLGVLLFFLSLAFALGLEAAKAETFPRRIIYWFFCITCACTGALWLTIKEIWPPFTLAIASIAKSPIAWFVVAIFVLSIFIFRRPKPVKRAKSNERVFTEIAPEELIGLYKNKSYVQAIKSVKPHIGKWLNVSGIVSNVYDDFVIFRDRDKYMTVHLNFDNEWKGPFHLLKVGQKISARGEIQRINNAKISLEHCELEPQSVEHREILDKREQGTHISLDDARRLDREVVRILELYNSMDVMSAVVEQSLSIRDISATSIIQSCLTASHHSLLAAFDFGITETWTIGVYRAVPGLETGKSILRCVAHLRSIETDLRESRVWPEGIGVAGTAYSLKKEIIVPDMTAPEIADAFGLSSTKGSYNEHRYVSIAAVPILPGAQQKPWGVAVVTSSRPGHFSLEPFGGMPTTEPIRAIARMAGLAIAATEK
jgi:hypothetical protein